MVGEGGWYAGREGQSIGGGGDAKGTSGGRWRIGGIEVVEGGGGGSEGESRALSWEIPYNSVSKADKAL